MTATTADGKGTDERKETPAEFKDAANMSAGALERWLDTAASKAVGQKRDGQGERTGHEMGRATVGAPGQAAGRLRRTISSPTGGTRCAKRRHGQDVPAA